MVMTSNQILKQQNEILQQNQKTINDLVRRKQSSEQTDVNNRSTKNNKEDERKQQQNLMRQATSTVNKELEQIKKVRDEIMKVAKDFMHTISTAKDAGGQKLTIPPQFSKLNQNLKQMVEVSQNNIQMLSPDKFELVNKLQNFNIEGYTHHVNQLKAQIAAIQKQSEAVERELRERVAKLEHINIHPKFQQQMLQPYKKNINDRLASINFEEARQAVRSKLGAFDYVNFDLELDSIMAEVKEEMAEVGLTFQKYKIQVPDVRFDPKELKALEVKLPSILDEYKAAHNIVLTRPRQVETQPKEVQSPKAPLAQTRKQSEEKRQPRSSKAIEGLPPTKPKDLASNVPLKRFNATKTVLGQDPEKERKMLDKRLAPKKQEQSPSPVRKSKQETDFEKYLENRANEELEEMYKQRAARIARLDKKAQQQQQEEGPRVHITLDNKRNNILAPKTELPPSSSQQPQSRPKNLQSKNQKQVTVNVDDRSMDTSMQSIGARIFDTRQNQVVKQIGTQVLKQRIKDIFSKEQNEAEPVPIRLDNRYSEPMVSPPVASNQLSANFAEGLFSVLNNTFAEMNKGLVAGLEKKMQEREKRIQEHGGLNIPLPMLQDIPKPPVFNLNFQRPIRGVAGYGMNPMLLQNQYNPQAGPPTFSNNFLAQQQQQQQLQQPAFGIYSAGDQYRNPSNVTIQKKEYEHVDISDISSYSHIDLDKSDRSEINSQISGISNITKNDGSAVERKKSSRL